MLAAVECALLLWDWSIQAGRCDGGTSVFAQFEVKGEGPQNDELHITWHNVGSGDPVLKDKERYVATIYGTERDVGYLIGYSGALSNAEYREQLKRDAPNAFAFLAYHEQGDCVKLK
ncbi:MAG: hypothetical protein A3H76_00980 [Candidatus Lloydbacteria bacterium RIFCSPLOWO2_02_FULL_54_12]|nr:MAG: hypothetical protein A2948_05960 [Candidatus Lloydbacteria bacterium RIFCSPLOWO2_01_FULL_54_18]OGZ17040.1 MAG: hypothetical protein A3H76_00980 [Candidatus Lloydbacteria bacterium RIFCSPLOWO2_02_FULL_54_12]